MVKSVLIISEDRPNNVVVVDGDPDPTAPVADAPAFAEPPTSVATPEGVVLPDDEATEAMPELSTEGAEVVAEVATVVIPELSTEGAEVVAGVATVAIPEGVVAGAE